MKWQATDAGPMQIRKFNRAWSELDTAYSTFESRHGGRVSVFNIGGRESSNPVQQASRAAYRAKAEDIGARWAWTLTRANAARIIAEVGDAAALRRASSPVGAGV